MPSEGHFRIGWPNSKQGGEHHPGEMMTPGPAPSEGDLPEVDENVGVDRPWLVLVWNDPINLMSYVSFVFQKLFGYTQDRADALMLDVHHKGRAVVSSGTQEKAEMDVFRLHGHGLWATMQNEGS